MIAAQTLLAVLIFTGLGAAVLVHLAFTALGLG